MGKGLTWFGTRTYTPMIASFPVQYSMFALARALGPGARV
jgi:hypothetical protein